MFVCIAGEEIVVWCDSWFLSPGMQQLSWPYASWQTPGVLFNQLRVRSSSLTPEGNGTILGVKHAQLQAGQLPSETSNRISSLWKCTAYCLVFVVVEEVLTLRWIGREAVSKRRWAPFSMGIAAVNGGILRFYRESLAMLFFAEKKWVCVTGLTYVPEEWRQSKMTYGWSFPNLWEMRSPHFWHCDEENSSFFLTALAIKPKPDSAKSSQAPKNQGEVRSVRVQEDDEQNQVWYEPQFCAAIEAQHSRADDFLLGVSTGRSWGVDPEDNIYSEALDPALKLVLQFSRDWLPWNHYEIPKSVDSQPSCEVAKCQTSFLQLAFLWTGELHPSIKYAADFSCILSWSLQTARRWRSGVWACHTSKENQFLWRLRRSMGPRENAAVVAAISSEFMFQDYKASFKEKKWLQGFVRSVKFHFLERFSILQHCLIWRCHQQVSRSSHQVFPGGWHAH